MADVFKKLNQIDMKTVLPILGQVLIDLKVLMSIGLIIFSIWAIGIETVYKPMNESLTRKDQALKSQAESYEQQKQLVTQYKEWQTQLKELNTDLYAIDPSQPATVAAANSKATLVKLIQGAFRSKSSRPPLPAPHDLRQRVEVIEKKHTQVSLGMTSEEAKPAESGEGNSDGAAAPGHLPGGKPPGESPGGGEEASAPSASAGQPSDTQNLKLEKFDYEVHVTGTYVGMADLLNELASQPNLVVVRSVKIMPADTGETEAAQSRPDPKATPDAPVKIDMILQVSMYLYQKTQ